MANWIRLPELNPVKMIDTADSFAYDKLASFEYKKRYCQKWNKSDTIQFQFSVLTGTIAYTLYIKDVNSNIVKTLTIAPKTTTIVDAYTYYEAVYNSNDLADGIYFFVLTISKPGLIKQFISEPQYILTSHENTVLIQYTNDINDFDVAFDNLTYYLRVEGGYLNSDYQFYSKDTIYKNQTFDSVLIDSIPFYTRKLSIGSSQGIPNWITKKINMIFSCNDIMVNDESVCKYEGAKLEPVRGDKIYPFSGWTIELIDSINAYSDEFVGNIVAIGSGGVVIGDDTGAITIVIGG